MSSILVLDDLAANRELLSTVLGYAGHTVVQAATGERALELVHANQPELIIVDLLMPGMNGCEFVGELRADPELRNTRVVLCTAIYDQGEVRSLAESCGVGHILVKPCEPEEIIRVVGEALDSNRGPSSQIVTDQFEREQLRVLNAKLIQKLDELELSKRLVEGKAEQLAISLKYKSEFFANMSHELRTPLNSVLILAGVLQDNPEQNLTAKQLQYVSVIHSAGTDLLRLLNDILDLAQFESGAVTAEISELALVEIQEALQREFAHVADQKNVSFSIELAGGLPSDIATDPARLRQVLNNLLANAFKFTERGAVSVRVSPAYSGWSATNDELSRAGTVIAFSITDTGIGMTVETQQRIFDDFVQGDGTTARQYSGTGLGLSISRKLVRLLGGEIAVTSTPDQGSTFTVYLPSSPI
jgi:signal transduction histidine kinase